MNKLKIPALLLIIFAAVSADISNAADGKAIVELNKCSSCHDMKGPAPATIAQVMSRKAPDLFYAGSKFQKEFLVGYLQRPYRIRPAGTVYLNNITAGDDIDRIQEPPLCASKLSKEDAEAASQYLMTLKDKDMQEGVYKPGAEFPRANAKLLFFKSGACNACHQVDSGNGIKGGVSAPALYNAGERLNGDWVFSYIKNPRHWDPKVWMPMLELPDNRWLLLTNYIMTMKKAN